MTGSKTEPAPNSIVSVGAVRFGNALPLALIAGPCQLESRAHALEMATALKEITQRLGIGLIYKTSFDKANRTSAKSARGLGLEKSLPIFAELREKLGIPVLTDVHDAAPMRGSHESRRCAANSRVPLQADRSADRWRRRRAARSTSRKASFSHRGIWRTSSRKSPVPETTTCW